MLLGICASALVATSQVAKAHSATAWPGQLRDELRAWIAQASQQATYDLGEASVRLAFSKQTGDRFYVIKVPAHIPAQSGTSANYVRYDYLFFVDPQLVNQNSVPLYASNGGKFPSRFGAISESFGDYQGHLIFLPGHKMLIYNSFHWTERALTPQEEALYFVYLKELKSSESFQMEPPNILAISGERIHLNGSFTILIEKASNEAKTFVTTPSHLRELVVVNDHMLALRSTSGNWQVLIPVKQAGPQLIAFSSKYLAVGDGLGTVRIYYLHSGELIKTIPSTEPLSAIYFQNASFVIEQAESRSVYDARDLRYRFAQSIAFPNCFNLLENLGHF